MDAIWKGLSDLQKDLACIYGEIRTFISKNLYYVITIYIVVCVSYFYFLTQIVFTNHTIPNSYMYGYPTFRTQAEGRWFADILIQLQGGFGSQSLQLFIGAALKIVNISLFMSIFRFKSAWCVFCGGLILELHPAFLDYYSFTIDSASFEFGDSLCLLAFLFFTRLGSWRIAATVGCCCMVLAVATYQPKVALLALLVVLWTVFGTTCKSDYKIRKKTLSSFGFRLFISSGVMVFALVFYIITLKFTIQYAVAERSHMNGLTEILLQSLHSYLLFYFDFFKSADYLPAGVRPLFFGAVILGVLVPLFKNFRTNVAVNLVSAALLLSVHLGTV